MGLWYNGPKPKAAWMARVRSLEDFFMWPMPHLDSPVMVSCWEPDPALPVDGVSRPALSYAGQQLLHKPPPGGY